MKSKIIWVYGGSAAGKETFIRNMEKNPPKYITNLLRWKDKKIIVSWKSINYIANERKDPKGSKREEILDEVLKLSKKENSVILIKGQDLDLERQRLGRLKEMLPSHKQEIIYLHTDSETMYNRCKRKPWWNKEWDKKGFVKWVKYQVRMLLKLKEFKIIALDSGDKGGYKRRTFPPKF
ncbi:hypothetical protein ACFLZZ_04350 [Nanoarchaeota archaeon]